MNNDVFFSNNNLLGDNTLESVSLDKILEENEQRLRKIATPYDPVAGDPDDGKRFSFISFDRRRLWLPVTMKKERILDEISFLAQSGDAPAIKKRKLTLELDRIRCRHDFPYWAATRAYIKKKGEGGDDILFVLNPPQRRLVETLETMRRNNEPMRLILLKARQWGGSTCIQLYMAWLQLVIEKGLNSLIVAHYNSAGDEVKDMLDRMLSRYEEVDEETGVSNGPVKTVRVGNSGRTMRIVSRNCKVKVATVERPDTCRGGDYNLVHCTEVGLWKTTRLKTPEQLLRSACSGVLFKPLTMIVYESTANGTGTFFHREYEAAKRGESQFRSMFVAWYEIPQYSLEFKPGMREVFARRIIEGKNAEIATGDRNQSGAYLWWLWQQGATLEAIHWYVCERAKFSNANLMAAEYPSDDVEAFVHSGNSVFDKYRVEAFREGCRFPFERGEISGAALTGEKSLKNIVFNPSESGSLRIWKRPEHDPEIVIMERYVVVVDIGGRSESADWSVIAVFDRNPMRLGYGPEIVAQWRGHADFDLLTWNAARIATFYDNALLVIESNTLDTRDPARLLDGDQSHFLFNQLAMVYPNLYKRGKGEDSILSGISTKYGFHTNISTKPMVISTLVQVIREKAYIERDEMCLDEYLTYEQKSNGSYGAISGHHDDLLMTRAIGLHICFNEMSMPRATTSRPDFLNLYHHRRPMTEATF